MKLIASILALPLKRILAVVAAPVAIGAYFVGLGPTWCLAMAAALIWIPPKALDSSLGLLADLRERRAMPYYRRASEFRNHRDYGRAIAEYDAAIRVDRDNMRAYINRGLLYYLRKEYDPAIADYTTAMNLDPRLRVLTQRKFEGSAAGDHYLAEAYARRGDALHRKGEDDLAIADYDAAIGCYPGGGHDTSRAYYERGLIYYGKRECDLAIADFLTPFVSAPTPILGMSRLSPTTTADWPISTKETMTWQSPISTKLSNWAPNT